MVGRSVQLRGLWKNDLTYLHTYLPTYLPTYTSESSDSSDISNSCDSSDSTDSRDSNYSIVTVVKDVTKKILHQKTCWTKKNSSFQ